MENTTEDVPGNGADGIPADKISCTIHDRPAVEGNVITNKGTVPEHDTSSYKSVADKLPVEVPQYSISHDYSSMGTVVPTFPDCQPGPSHPFSIDTSNIMAALSSPEARELPVFQPGPSHVNTIKFTAVPMSQPASELTDCQPGPSRPFHIDTSMLTAIPTAQQASELQDLGLTVFNQADFEQGIMAQVDQAMAAEEQARMKKLLQKEMNTVTDEIRSIKQELAHIDKVLCMLQPHTGNREAQRKLESVKRQKENKIKQMKKLKAKQKSLKLKIDGTVDGLDDDDDDLLLEPAEAPVALEEALGLVKATETEVERMIRLGEMTPFGTVMNFKADTSKGKSPAPPKAKPKIVTDKMSDFEMFLMGQDAKNASRKTTPKKAPSTVTKTSESTNTERIPSSSKRKHKIHKSKSESDIKRVKSDSGSDRCDSPQFEASGGHMYSRKGSQNLFDDKDKRSYRPSEIDFSQPRYDKARKKKKVPTATLR